VRKPKVTDRVRNILLRPLIFVAFFRLFLASAMLMAPAALPASALDLGSLFKRKQLDAREVGVDSDAAVRMISDYRRKHGLGPLKLDSKLTRIAATHALKMAKVDKVDHVLRGEGSFARRLSAGGYDAAVASENIGAGYYTLAEAFAGWRKSREHNKNMLRSDVTVMGIARADSAGGKYGTYWSLVLARPYEGPSGPSAGPPTGPSGLMIGR
jgi:uncharacterized protein YkwD